MREGDHESAWALSEQAVALRPPREDDSSLPYHLRRVWDLRTLDGRDVVVRSYHGLGDTIQFLRFLPELKRRAASVTLEIQPRLIPLLGDNPPVDRIIGFDTVHPLPRTEFEVEIMELSFALRLAPAACPPPYLMAPPVRQRPGAIGICCVAGNWNPSRSIPAELLAPLCRGRECYTLDLQASSLPVRNPWGCPEDMAETAALIAQCALIITVDTMAAHLAGALNKPTWLLLQYDPDWRWAPHSKSSEWYPSMRLYTQPHPGDWEGVIAEVHDDLNSFIPSTDFAA